MRVHSNYTDSTYELSKYSRGRDERRFWLDLYHSDFLYKLFNIFNGYTPEGSDATYVDWCLFTDLINSLADNEYESDNDAAAALQFKEFVFDSLAAIDCYIIEDQ